MKGQNFGLMKELVPYVISGRKYVTSRVATEFRRKLVIGGRMNFFTGLRTPNCKRFGTGIVKDKIYWWIKQLPARHIIRESSILNESPLKDMDWKKFSYIEGFEEYNDFYHYFTNHPKRDLIDKVGLILFVFDFSIERLKQKELML